MNATIVQDPNIRQIEWTEYGQTVLNPLALLLTLAMIVLIIVINRKYALIPMLIVATLITTMQRIVIAGLDFDMLRLLIIGGMLRVILRNEYRSVQFNLMDKFIIAWLVIRFVAQTILWGTMGRVTYNLGYTYNAVGMYFMSRMFIRDREDVKVIIVTLIVTSAIVSVAMLNEQLTGRNIFSIFGGVPAMTFVREGRLRSQAAFSHPILAGSFGAHIFPLAWALLHQGNVSLRRIGKLGLVVSTLVVITAASSGPVIALAGGMFAVFMWRFRLYMRKIFWLGVGGLVALDLVMDSPVYALIWRVGVVGGSTGFHRYRLIDAAVRNFEEWWLLGVRTTAHWGWGLQDVTNMFISQGVNSNFFGMLMFAAAIMVSYRAISAMVGAAPYSNSSKLLWGIGAAQFTHTVSFFGVSYFGQMMFFWYLTMAMIASLWQSEGVPAGISLYHRNEASLPGAELQYREDS